MDSHSKELTVAAVAWCDEAAAVLSAAVSCPVVELQQQAEAGAVLFRVTKGGDLVGYYLLRVDRTSEGAEGVILAGAGKDGLDLLIRIMPHIERQFVGCYGVRVHTERPGMARQLAKMGYRSGEIVMRKKLQ